MRKNESFLRLPSPATVSAAGGSLSAPFRKVDATRSKERAYTVVARLAVDVFVIASNRIERHKRLAARRPLAQKAVERLLPSRGMHPRGLGEHAAQIK